MEISIDRTILWAVRGALCESPHPLQEGQPRCFYQNQGSAKPRDSTYSSALPEGQRVLIARDKVQATKPRNAKEGVGLHISKTTIVACPMGRTLRGRQPLEWFSIFSFITRVMESPSHKFGKKFKLNFKSRMNGKWNSCQANGCKK